MEIVRLPVAPLARPANPSTRQAQQPPFVAPAARAERPGPGPGAAGGFERVVQGELLEREGPRYQSTRAFLVERSMERAQPAERQPATLHQTRPAIARYLNHSRPESVPEMVQGRSLNLFV